MPLYALKDAVPELPEEGAFYIAPTAVLIGRVRLMKNASVWFGAVLRGDNDWITIGENANVQDNAVIHTDPGLPVVLSANVTVGHNAIIHSAEVGEGSLIGMGAILLNGAKIGARSVVGAGTLVTEGKSFADGSLIVGSPARMIRSLTEDEQSAIGRGAAVYLAKSVSYRDELVLRDDILDKRKGFFVP